MSILSMEETRAKIDAEGAAMAVAAGGGAVSPVMAEAGQAIWRAEVKRRCKEAGVRVRTGRTDGGTAVWAVAADAQIAPAGQMTMAATTWLRTYGDHGHADAGRVFEADSMAARRRLVERVSAAIIGQRDQ